MADSIEALSALVREKLGSDVIDVIAANGEVTLDVQPAKLISVGTRLRDDAQLRFDMLVDLCGVDYAAYGQTEWNADTFSGGGFSRGADHDRQYSAECRYIPSGRYAVVIHLLSVSSNLRLRIRTFCEDDEFPKVDSVTSVWNSANWYEREAFDLYGILFEGHPDLRRILTDYGFVGHPFRKDFPLSGHVEMRYDPAKQRVVYEPVQIEPRVLVPRVIRSDHRYLGEGEEPDTKAQG